MWPASVCVCVFQPFSQTLAFHCTMRGLQLERNEFVFIPPADVTEKLPHVLMLAASLQWQLSSKMRCWFTDVVLCLTHRDSYIPHAKGGKRGNQPQQACPRCGSTRKRTALTTTRRAASSVSSVTLRTRAALLTQRSSSR